MAVITKKVGKSRYAYLVERQGDRVVHRYLGRADGERARKMAALNRSASEVPEGFRSLFWDTDLENIHLGKNARYVIERVLTMGDLRAVSWLERIYTHRKIIEVLLTARSIDSKSRGFWCLWFGVDDE